MDEESNKNDKPVVPATKPAADDVTAVGESQDSAETATADSGDAASVAANPAPETEQPPARPVSRQADRPASARWLVVLTLLIALGALGLAGWLYMQQQLRLDQQLLLQGRIEAEIDRIRGTAEDARSAIDDAIQATRRSNAELRTLIDEERSRQARELAAQRDAMVEIEATLRGQRQQLLELRSTDRADWSLAEAEYLLRLAFQRLVMADDITSAVALLGSADAILRQLDDTDLLPAREAIARDLAALKAVPEVDIDGAWLRLQALAERIDGLLLFELRMEETESETVPEDAGWQERLAQGFRAALAKISDYVRIRRREQPYETLIDPQWEQLVRQNLRMQIAQAQAALLSGNPVLYEASLSATRRWLREFFDFNQADVESLDEELDALMGLQITRQRPDIGDSLAAVREAIDLRHAEAGGP